MWYTMQGQGTRPACRQAGTRDTANDKGRGTRDKGQGIQPKTRDGGLGLPAGRQGRGIRDTAIGIKNLL
ncbi:MAG: hypothetical protein ACK5AO_09315 [bacterium]